MAKSIKVHKSDVKVQERGSQAPSPSLKSNPTTKSRTSSMVKPSVIPWDNDAKLVTPGNAGSTGWLPEDMQAPEFFDKVCSGGWDGDSLGG